VILVVHRYDQYEVTSENCQCVSTRLTLANRHYYEVSTPTQSYYYFYVDVQGNVLEFDNQELFDLSVKRNDPSLGYGHEPVVGVTKPSPQRPTRFERLLRDTEIWEEYHPPPKPIPETKSVEVTEDDLAAIFNKPQRLVSQAPNPMDIDILKCMEEVVGKSEV
jgi:hypothetical protein